MAAKSKSERAFDRAAPSPDWFLELFPGGDGRGFLERIDGYAISLTERPAPEGTPRRLVVTFDNVAAAGDLSVGREPWGYKFFREQNASHLNIFTIEQTWFRNTGLIHWLEKRAAQGLFDGYDDVIFAGSSMGAFAALAFAPLAPGSRVIAFNPQSTLNPEIVPWEHRYRKGRRQDWQMPFGDGADGLDQIGHAYVFYDPFLKPDDLHAKRLINHNVTQLKVWFAGHFTAVYLSRLRLLKPVMLACMEQKLTPEEFYRMFRIRRAIPWYIREMRNALIERGQDDRIPLAEAMFKKYRMRYDRSEDGEHNSF